MNCDFDTLLRRISPRLKRMARSHKALAFFIDENDLYQEMCIYLWKNYRNGPPAGINEAYIIKGCEFHILNYLRKGRGSRKILSLEKPVNEEGCTLKDLLSDEKESLDKLIDRNLAIEDIKNNGFTNREKEVFSLLLKGFTVRETGKELGISHVMVVKVKNRIIKKWQKKEKTGVTKRPDYLLNRVDT